MLTEILMRDMLVIARHVGIVDRQCSTCISRFRVGVLLEDFAQCSRMFLAKRISRAPVG